MNFFELAQAELADLQSSDGETSSTLATLAVAANDNADNLQSPLEPGKQILPPANLANSAKESRRLATIATLAGATNEAAEADEKRKEAIARLINQTLRLKPERYNVKAVTNEILTWPAEDLSDLLNNPGLANCAIDCVAMRHRIWRFGEAGAHLRNLPAEE